VKRPPPFLALFTTLALASCASPPTAPYQAPAPRAPLPSPEVFFSPRGGAEDAILREIQAAQTSIRVLAYSFTSEPIATALESAKARGLDVLVILDKSQRRGNGSKAQTVAASGVPVFIDSAHAIQHNKVIIIDSTTIITGSFNFSRAAEERNAENLLIIRDAALADRYLADWETHRAHAPKFEP
jgi:phosphatidylserine/phosphatidylglycerophosphate/cardiolipin synthase-like enzyme